MVSASKLNSLINKAARHSNWEGAHVDAASLAHSARIQHAVETLVQLGHDNLAAELLRLERRSYEFPTRVSITEFPPAA